MENSMRVKLMMSNELGYRITYQCSIVDVSGVGITTLNVMNKFLKKVTGDIQLMYPEVVKRSYIVNCGWLFNTAWKIIRKFLHPDTVAKIDVFGSDYKKKLNDVGITKIPTFLGGTCSDYILGFDNLYPVGSRIVAEKGLPEKSLSLPPVELDGTPDDKLQIGNLEEVLDIKDDPPIWSEEVGVKTEIKALE